MVASIRASAPSVRILASFHDFEGIPDDLERLPARMAAIRPDAVKIAVAASDHRERGGSRA